MSTIVLYGSDFNKIMRSLRHFVSKIESREALRNVKIEHEAGSGTVTAIGLDGFRLAKVVVPACGANAVNTTIPLCPVTKAKSVSITDDGEHIIFVHEGMYTITYHKPKGEFINWKQIIPSKPPQYEISVNPRMLAEALSSFPQDTKTITMRFVSNVDPILIEQQGSEDQMLVLPVRVSR